ncbi:hypothetical protein AVP42_00898 [Agromyces sp. NDB4Y10]|uniref:PIN-like domain-containing protein n=1 Tax=Agromyces sp. NDB4Y10 TaxID=1775951 RepID=UPI0007B29F4F|nr:hypothetical protein [Agromyces sp. NDB4Y10]KZE94614.1 hypothetical protein AVP42_00898 [Agromyces sp. NDB4Y10]
MFIDRGMGSRIVPDGLRAAGWDVETMDERYGPEVSKGLSDVRWIAEAATAGDVILCKDRRVASNPLEAQTIYMHDARVFVLANQNITGPHMLRWLIANEDRIFRWAIRAGPYVVAVHEQRLERLRLNYP